MSLDTTNLKSFIISVLKDPSVKITASKENNVIFLVTSDKLSEFIKGNHRCDDCYVFFDIDSRTISLSAALDWHCVKIDKDHLKQPYWYSPSIDDPSIYPLLEPFFVLEDMK